MKLFWKSENIEEDGIIQDLRRKIGEARMPSPVEKIALQELETLTKIGPSTAEYTIGLTYIDYLTTLPWSKKTVDNLDLDRAERALDENHFGLRKVKERIIEHLAIKVLRTTRKPRVLVVDDEETARKNLSHILTRENYEVSVAASGEEALRVLDSRECDVVITDLRMASVDGMELLENAALRHPETGLIVVTGYASIPSAIEAVKKGATHYIEKPFKLDEVRTAVRQSLEQRTRAGSTKGTILCFAGPPGTGKTSVGRAIAQALGRKFARIALGGMKDEADIRGHRRTYVGAMPGRIIEEIHRLDSANPVIMLDELDKIPQLRDFKGDPASALLEVLDPEQNRAFTDHYLDVPFDLSSVMFILTANVMENVPAPLRDRMEIIEFSGYTQEEKQEIASRFLVPKQVREKGLSPDQVEFSPGALGTIIREYTHEAGIRGLERSIATICRKVARESLRTRKDGPVRITPDAVEKYLGRKSYRFDAIGEQDRIGVATSLVRTEVGGEIIFVEAAMMKGEKELIITGLLGEVMRESAHAALSYIRSNAAAFGVSEDFFEHRDLHIHVPRGAIQKDGPSAGLTIAMALLSLLTRRPARRDVATSGEITLTGRVLPVGGIREKVLAAKRAEVRTVVLPAKNRAETEALDDEISSGIDIRLVETVAEAVDLVLR